jgi:GST-like protein
MIDLFYHTTPNARKVLMMLEEVGAPYRIVWTDIARGDQFKPEYLAVNPNGKVPAIIDRDGPDDAPIRVFESGAILLYLAEKYGKLLPRDQAEKYDCIAWVCWQVGGQGPMSGQAAHFVSHAPKAGIDIPYARERYVREVRRHYDVLENVFRTREWLVGDTFTIADLAAFPWTRVSRGHGVDLIDYPAVKAWSDRIAERPSAKVRPEAANGVERGQGYKGYDPHQWQTLFGAGQASLGAQRASN